MGVSWEEKFDQVLLDFTLDIQFYPPVIPGENRCEFGIPLKAEPQEMSNGGFNTNPHVRCLDV